ncbi:hypothetical protein EsH8_XIV_000008 [Colletotrichum jinshuiense]
MCNPTVNICKGCVRGMRKIAQCKFYDAHINKPENSNMGMTPYAFDSVEEDGAKNVDAYKINTVIKSIEERTADLAGTFKLFVEGSEKTAGYVEEEGAPLLDWTEKFNDAVNGKPVGEEISYD